MVVSTVSQPPPSNVVTNNQYPTPTVNDTNQTGYFGAVGPTSTANLSLENGMTAGYGNNDGRHSNPQLLNNVQNGMAAAYGGNPNFQPNRIGLMRNLPYSLPDSTINTLYFLYNPTEIDVGFTADSSQYPANYLYGGSGSNHAANGATAGFDKLNPGASKGLANYASAVSAANTQTVSFQLFFDRTYDMSYGPNPQDSVGVLKDVAALYNLMGTFSNAGAIPMSVPIQCLFGVTGAGNMWGVTGFISGFSIQYGIFRYDMIPSKCLVSISMTTAYVASQLPAGDTASDTVSTGGGAATYANAPPVLKANGF